MNFIEDYPFSKLSSLRTTETASFFCELSDINQIDEIVSFSKEKNLPILIIGEGTNITCFNLKTDSIKVLYANECEFGYRTSIFKDCSDYIILSVTFQFKTDPKINYSYSSLEDEINKNNINKDNLTHRDIFNLVSKIRKKVLPDYKEFPNVGSFFKNVVLTKEEFNKLDITEEIPVYPEGENIKISAAFLIEKFGWKGFREGSVGISDQHALVLVTYEETPGDEILKFSNKIINQIFSITGIKLEIEPTLI